ncbi:MAG TPA: nucleotidyltransferase family protein, partial [Desulfobaccales bacterium]
LKGPVLAKMAYGDLALRQFYDLDILVRPQDMSPVNEALLSAGYSPLDTFTPKQERLHLKRAYELSFVHPKFTELDIHWRFPDFLGGGLHADTAFGRKVQVNLEGKPVYALAPEDMLLFLCLHGGFEAWPTLSMVSDVARFLQCQETWDWSGLMHRAESLGMRRRLLLGLSLAEELLAAPVPSSITARINADPVLLGPYQQIQEKLLAGSSSATRFGAKNLFQIKIRERLKDKLAFVWVRSAVSQKADWWWLPLPDYLYWLYPIIRPLRLMSQYLIRVGGRK